MVDSSLCKLVVIVHQTTFAKTAMAMLAARYTLQKYTKSWGWMPLTAHFLYCKQKFLDWVRGYDSWPNATRTRAARGVETIKISKIKKVLEISRLQRPTQFINQKIVVPPGIEPGTQGFSVLCSTN